MPEKKVPPQKRKEDFLKVFRNFDSKREGAEWIAEVTGSSVATVFVWRCKTETGYTIPMRPYKMLMEAVAKKNFPNFPPF